MEQKGTRKFQFPYELLTDVFLIAGSYSKMCAFSKQIFISNKLLTEGRVTFLHERSEGLLLGSSRVSFLVHAYSIVMHCYFPLVNRSASIICIM